MKTVFCTLLVAFFSLWATAAEKMPREDVIEIPAIGKGLCLHNLFQTNMVLQRNKPITIRGWADPKEKVSVTFNAKVQQTVAGADRSWKVTFPALPASSKPKTITVKGKQKTLKLENILIGDVWVLGGQSNMEFPLTKVENGNLEIISANFPQIRILTVPAVSSVKNIKGFNRLHEWSSWFNRHFRKGDWDVCSPQTVKELSAIGYTFARRIHMATQVPIGVIDISRGGTTIETWTPRSELAKIESKEVNDKIAEWDLRISQWDAKKDLEKRVESYKIWLEQKKKSGKPIPTRRKMPTDLRPGPALDQNRPGNCYAGMLAPISGLNVKGAIFHQGYNNALSGRSAGAKMYADIFPVMISSWRKAFNDESMPFGILSLCTAGPTQTRDTALEFMINDGPFIREAQYNTFLNLYNSGDKNIGFTSTYDLRRSWYHPQLKIPAGERIARWALATQYGFANEVSWKPPIITKMAVKEGKLLLHLDCKVKSPQDDEIKGFVIAGKDQKWQPAEVAYYTNGKDGRGQVKYDRSILVLSSKYIAKPIHYRYAWARNPDANVQIDSMKDIPLATQRSDKWEVVNSRALRNAYKQEDLKRKLMEAQELLDTNKKIQ